MILIEVAGFRSTRLSCGLPSLEIAYAVFGFIKLFQQRHERLVAKKDIKFVSTRLYFTSKL
jgi:hypothetical protein